VLGCRAREKNKINNSVLGKGDAQIDRHGEAFMRIFAIIFIASVLKRTEKGHQYEDMYGVTSIKIVYVDVDHRRDTLLVKFAITLNSKLPERRKDGAGTEPCQITESFVTASLLGSYLTTLAVTLTGVWR
jgi:hypothetical protein